MRVLIQLGASTTFGDFSPSSPCSADDLLNFFEGRTPSQNSNPAKKFFFVTHGTRALAASFTLSGAGVKEDGTLVVHPRILGGGGDGGATGAESRDCYLKMYSDKKPDKVDPTFTKIARWSRCALSSELLTPPCVIDRLGNMFNKEAVVKALIERSMPKSLYYIRGLKDLVEIHLHESSKEGSRDSSVRFSCPITGQDFNGCCKFFALRTCGHVLSQSAFSEIKSDSCLVCQKPFLKADKLTVNPTEEESDALRETLEEERLKSRPPKKEKRKLTVTESVGGEQGAITGSGIKLPESVNDATKKDVLMSVDKKVSLVNTQEKSAAEKKKRPKGSDIVHQPKRYKAASKLPPGATKEIYASIFTSSRKEELKETYSCRSLPLARN